MVKQNLTKKVWRIKNKVVPLHRQSEKDKRSLTKRQNSMLESESSDYLL